MTDADLYLILNPVRTEQADDFERHVREVLVPAVRAHQPETVDKVRLWRASDPEAADAGITVFAFTAEGIRGWEDLGLGPAYEQAFGEAGGQEALEAFGAFFVDHSTWAASWSRHEDTGSQYGWQMSPRPMGG